MSRESAAEIVLPKIAPAEEQVDLSSLHEGIALLARLEQMLVDMHLSLDDLSIAPG